MKYFIKSYNEIRSVDCIKRVLITKQSLIFEFSDNPQDNFHYDACENSYKTLLKVYEWFVDFLQDENRGLLLDLDQIIKTYRFKHILEEQKPDDRE